MIPPPQFPAAGTGAVRGPGVQGELIPPSGTDGPVRPDLAEVVRVARRMRERSQQQRADARRMRRDLRILLARGTTPTARDRL
ncbi:hypothetical protein [Streptomyces sp. NPDC045470]|uniref:hypothetical protein n=1 Tax=unclassified Streptomyces TaxID=2593676 RepID=UPI0033E941D3